MENYPLRPSGLYLLGRVDEAIEEKVGEFVLPKNYHQKPMVVQVVLKGDGVDGDGRLEVAVGDRVLLPKNGATSVEIGTVKYQLFKLTDIVGVM